MQKNSSLSYSNLISNIYIVYKLNNWLRNTSNDFTMKKCLFGTVKLTRNLFDKGGVIAFDEECSWSFSNDFARNFAFFGVNNSSSIQIEKIISQC